MTNTDEKFSRFVDVLQNALDYKVVVHLAPPAVPGGAEFLVMLAVARNAIDAEITRRRVALAAELEEAHDWRARYKPGDTVEVRHTHTAGGENDWSRVTVSSHGEDRYDSFIEIDMNGVGFRVHEAEDIRMPCGPRFEGETVYDSVTQKKIHTR